MFDTGFVAVVFSVWAALATNWEAPLARGPADPGVALSFGQTYKDYVSGSQEVRVTYLTPVKIGVAQVMFDGSVTGRGGIYAGVGGRMARDFDIGVPAFASASLSVGVWAPGDDVDLGFPLNFRADVELGVRVTDRVRVGLVWDHRSHGYVGNLFDEDAPNRGIESLSLRVTGRF